MGGRRGATCFWRERGVGRGGGRVDPLLASPLPSPLHSPPRREEGFRWSCWLPQSSGWNTSPLRFTPPLTAPPTAPSPPPSVIHPFPPLLCPPGGGREGVSGWADSCGEEPEEAVKVRPVHTSQEPYTHTAGAGARARNQPGEWVRAVQPEVQPPHSRPHRLHRLTLLRPIHHLRLLHHHLLE